MSIFLVPFNNKILLGNEVRVEKISKYWYRVWTENTLLTPIVIATIYISELYKTIRCQSLCHFVLNDIPMN